jgi:hypothetical protein
MKQKEKLKIWWKLLIAKLKFFWGWYITRKLRKKKNRGISIVITHWDDIDSMLNRKESNEAFA